MAKHLWWWVAILACATISMPSQSHMPPSLAIAQQGDGTEPTAPEKLGEPDIVVSGLINRKKGPWKRAEAEHVIVIAQNSVDELRRITRNVESLHYLLSRLYRRGDTSDVTKKVEPVITPLFPAAAALIAAKIELGARLAAQPIATGSALPAPTLVDAQRSVDWLARVRGVADLYSDGDTLAFAAEAECRAGNPDRCLAYAERALDKAPNNVLALTWKGVALTNKAVSAPVANQPATLALARMAIQRAIALDGQSPLPRIAYFQSFTKLGVGVPMDAMAGLVDAIRRVPAAPKPRLYLGEELVRQGEIKAARQILHTVLYAPYESPERTGARALFAMPPTGAGSGN
ncbi:tetratricopeptide repeat protein [Sphingomonas sp.]|uniref:tetratricopeptide repeat protein n=1 Tax=Sphingomonas sp. TaxID=28214 RepID=UPI0035A854AD